MAINSSTRPSDASSGASEPALRDPEPLSFPVDEDPSFNPPLVSLQVMMERSADLRRWLPRGIPTDEERLATKCYVVFQC